MSFDRLAPHYLWMERVLAGSKLQRCRTAFLPELPPPTRVLLLGEGAGLFLARLLQDHPSTAIVCVDSSAAMLNRAGARAASAGLDLSQVQFCHANVLNWRPNETPFDLVATHFFLDCFRAEQLSALVRVIAQAAQPGASWLLADFRAPSKGWQRWRALLILRVMYAFFRATTDLEAQSLTRPDGMLAAAGFSLRNRRITEWGLLQSDWWQKKTGPGFSASIENQ